MNQDKLSCDYDTEQIKEDSRFRQCSRDMVLVQVSYLGYTVLLVLLSYLLCPDNISQMTYLFGLPLWAAAALILTILFVVFIVIWALKSPNFSLKAREEEISEGTLD